MQRRDESGIGYGGIVRGGPRQSRTLNGLQLRSRNHEGNAGPRE